MNKRKYINRAYRLLNGYSPFKFTVQLSINDTCNKACNFCPIHSPLIEKGQNAQSFVYENQKEKVMSSQTFRRFIHNDIRKISHISVCGRGEPLLHPNFVSIMYAIDMYKPFSVTTNGILLPKYIDFLLSLKNLTGIRVSNGDGKIDHPKVSYAKIYTKGETGDLPAYWVSGLDDIAVLPEGFSDQYVREIGCITPYTFAFIAPDGGVYPCCHTIWKVGNINDQTFDQIVNSGLFRGFRKDIYNITRGDCESCGHHII